MRPAPAAADATAAALEGGTGGGMTCPPGVVGGREARREGRSASTLGTRTTPRLQRWHGKFLPVIVTVVLCERVRVVVVNWPNRLASHASPRPPKRKPSLCLRACLPWPLLLLVISRTPSRLSTPTHTYSSCLPLCVPWSWRSVLKGATFGLSQQQHHHSNKLDLNPSSTAPSPPPPQRVRGQVNNPPPRPEGACQCAPSACLPWASGVGASLTTQVRYDACTTE